MVWGWVLWPAQRQQLLHRPLPYPKCGNRRLARSRSQQLARRKQWHKGDCQVSQVYRKVYCRSSSSRLPLACAHNLWGHKDRMDLCRQPCKGPHSSSSCSQACGPLPRCCPLGHRAGHQGSSQLV